MSSSPPTLSVALSIQPSQFAAGSGKSEDPPMITITATSHATRPITIFTWPEIFNLNLSQKRKNFTCLDLNTGEPVRLEITKGPKRPGFSREAGGIDDADFYTLEPEVPITFTGPFKLAYREGKDSVTPGHRYRFAVSEGETIHWWRYGTKAEVMAPAGQPAGLGDASGPPIALDDFAAVEFEVTAD